MAAKHFNGNEKSPNFDLEGEVRHVNEDSLVAVGGKLPYCSQVPTSKVLDVVLAITPSAQRATRSQKKKLRKTLGQRLYTRTRPGLYMELSESLHLSYAGQPDGHGSQHHWRLFYDDRLKDQLDVLITGTALVTSSNQNNGKYTKEWGGLYLRSEAELRIAKALDQSGVLFFANIRGRVSLQHTALSNNQLTGRIEADFLVMYKGKSMILEVDGQHHLEEEQTLRDYARDRVLLRSGVPTVRFTGRDCLDNPKDVVSEFLSILQEQ